MSTSFPTASVYTDIQGLQSLKNAADKNSPEALKEAAKQFEALFIQNLLKNMRAAKLDDGLLGSDQGDMYLDMFDKQLSLTMAQQKGIGLADMLYEQLKYTLGDDATRSTNSPKTLSSLGNYQQHPVSINNSHVGATQTNSSTNTKSDIEFNSSNDFIKQLWPLAKGIAEKLGTSPEMILAQAALETGWGKHIIQIEKGSSSFNVFNIKVSSDWKGPMVAKKTLEYQDGKYQQMSANFKVYDSYAQSFSDYLKHIETGEKYQLALQNVTEANQYAQALQQAGYATDPLYSKKIVAVMDGAKMKQAIGLMD